MFFREKRFVEFSHSFCRFEVFSIAIVFSAVYRLYLTYIHKNKLKELHQSEKCKIVQQLDFQNVFVYIKFEKSCKTQRGNLGI